MLILRTFHTLSQMAAYSIAGRMWHNGAYFCISIYANPQKKSMKKELVKTNIASCASIFTIWTNN